MKAASMLTFVLAILVPLATLFTAAAAACNNVATMERDDACHKSCNMKPEWVKLCQDTLRPAPDTAEVTSYALMATRQASLKYGDTMNTINQMLGAGNLPSKEREAVSHCKGKYREAAALMGSVAKQMDGCDFTRGRQEYIDAQVAVGSCQDGLWSFQYMPLYATVTADHDLTMVAFELGALIFGK